MLSYEFIAYDAINSLRGKRHEMVHLSSIRSFFKRKLKDEGRPLYKGFDKRLHSRLKEMVEEGKLISDERGLRFGLTSQARKIVNQRKRDGLDLDFRLLSTPGKGRAGTATPRSSGKKRGLPQSRTPKKRTASGTPLKTPTSTKGRLFSRGTVGSEDDTESESEPEAQNMFDGSPLVRRKTSQVQSSADAHRTPQRTTRTEQLRSSQQKSREMPSRGVSKRQTPKSTPRRRLHTSDELTEEEVSRLRDELAKAMDEAARLQQEKIDSERSHAETARQQNAELAAIVLEKDAALQAADRARVTLAEKEAIVKLAEEKLRASEAKLQELERQLESVNRDMDGSSAPINDSPKCNDENEIPETIPTAASSLENDTEVDDRASEEQSSPIAEVDPTSIGSFDPLEATWEDEQCPDAGVDVTETRIVEVNMMVERTTTEDGSVTNTRIEETVVLPEQVMEIPVEDGSATSTHIEETVTLSEQTTEILMEDVREPTINFDRQTDAEDEFSRLRKDYETLKAKLLVVESERDAAVSQITEVTSNADQVAQDILAIQSERNALLREIQTQAITNEEVIRAKDQLAEKILQLVNDCERLTSRETSTDADAQKLKVCIEILEGEAARYPHDDRTAQQALLRTIKKLCKSLESRRRDANDAITNVETLQRALEEKQGEISMRTKEFETARLEVCSLREEKAANGATMQELRSAFEAMKMEMEEKTRELQSHLEEAIQAKILLNSEVIQLKSSLVSDKADFESYTKEMESAIQQLKKEIKEKENNHNAKVAELSADSECAQAAIAKLAQENADIKLKASQDSAAAREELLQVQGKFEESERENREKLAKLTKRAETAEAEALAHRDAGNEKDRLVDELQASVARNETRVRELESMVAELGSALEKEKDNAKEAATTTENLRRALEEKESEVSLRAEELETVRSEIVRLQDDKSANEATIQKLQSAIETMRVETEKKTEELQSLESRLGETVNSKELLNTELIELKSSLASEKAGFESRTKGMETAIEQLKKEMDELSADVERTRAAFVEAEKKTLNATADSAAAQDKILQVQGALDRVLEEQKFERAEFAKVAERLKKVETELKASLEQVGDSTSKLGEARMQIAQDAERHEQLTVEIGRTQEARDLERKAAQEALDEAGRKLTETEAEREEVERRLTRGAELVELMRACVQPIRCTSKTCSVAETRVDSGVAGIEWTSRSETVTRVSRVQGPRMEVMEE